MPTYQYACTTCDHRFEAVQSFTDSSLTECPACSGTLRKVFSSVGIVFKGSGFYRTDSRAGAGSTVSKGDGSKGEGSKGEGSNGESSKGESSKGESKGGSDSAGSSSKSSSSTGKDGSSGGKGNSSNTSSSSAPAAAAS